jgi:hypothetical protein
VICASADSKVIQNATTIPRINFAISRDIDATRRAIAELSRFFTDMRSYNPTENVK